jgi:hypothetical protein
VVLVLQEGSIVALARCGSLFALVRHIQNNHQNQQHGANKAISVGDKVFHYDHVFDEQSTQDVIFDCGVREMVEGCFEGFNATVFAYGQTVRVSIIFALVFYIGVK